MAIQLGSAYGKVALDVKGLLDGVKNGKVALTNLAEAGEKLGAGLKNAGRTLTLGLTLPIAALSGAAVKAASDFEESKNKAVVVFGEMADEIIANSDKATTALGIGQTQYLNYASSLGAAFTAGGLGIQESTKLSEQAIKHFADLASFHNGNVEDIAAAWQSAIRGQYEPIQRYFPFITNEYLKTYGTANGLVDANTKNLTANQRAIILNAIALDSKLNPAIDDFARTSGGLANQGRITTAEFNKLLIKLGQNLLPIVAQLVIWLNKFLEALNKMSPGQQKVVLGFLAMAAAAGPLLSVLGTLVSTVSGIVGLFGSLTGASVSLAGIGTTLSGVVVPSLGAVGAALLPILAVLASLIIYLGIFVVAWRKDFLFVRSAAETAAKIVGELWAALLAFLRGDTEGALAHIAEAFNAFGEHITNVFQRVFGIQNAWQQFINFINRAVTQMVNYISKAFSSIRWGDIGKYILLGLANGMLLGLPNLLVIAKRIADQLLAQIKRSLGIHSPSAEMMKLGAFTAQGFLLGMQKVSPDDMARSLVKPITNQSSTQQTVIQNFNGGLTLKQVRSEIAASQEQWMNTLIGALNG